MTRMTEAMMALAGETATVVDTRTLLRSAPDGTGGAHTTTQDRSERSVSLG